MMQSQYNNGKTTMNQNNFIVFVGPACSGKSTLIYAYSKWLKDTIGIKTFKVNLDPAADYIPYEPDFDIRCFVDADKIAREYGLGPNGALVKAMDIIAEKIRDFMDIFVNAGVDFVLIDTPGQMEVFLFRDIAFKLIEWLKKVSRSIVSIFVIDADVIKRYEDYAFLSIISVAVQVRLGVDVIPVINKIDLASIDDLIGDIISDVDIIGKKLKGLGVYGEMLENILNIIALYSKAIRVPKVSAKNFIGLEELHRIIHEITCACGDLS
jgi:GTPase SAR1 family protein